tara:strand:+ start:6245 stop:8074 length:1830 start_codon:yes stop_codon:yes gene_type:complete
MANKKFSEFTTKTDPANVDFVVGYDGSTNVKIAPGNLSSGGATSLNGLTDCLVDTDSLYVGEVPAGLSGNPQNNTVLGIDAGNALTTGTFHTLIGNDAGLALTTQFGVTAVGHLAGKTQNAESYGTYIGYKAGESATGTQQTIIGANTRQYSAGGDSTGMVIVGYNAQDVQGAVYCTSVGFGAGSSNQGANTVSIGKDTNRVNTAAQTVSVGYKAGYSQTSGASNTNLGYNAGYANTSSGSRTCIGFEAGENNTGASNTFIGIRTGEQTGTGDSNTAIGAEAGRYITTGARNVMVGMESGQWNQAGDDNVSVGYQALVGTGTEKDRNVAIGSYAGTVAAGAFYNTLVGYSSGKAITDGDHNTFIGNDSGLVSTTGANNTIIGSTAMDANTDGGDNVAIGYAALGAETSGDQNTAIGFEALVAQDQQGIAINTAVGYRADDGNLTGYHRVCIGGQAGNSSATGNNVICIGYNSNEGSSSASNVVTLGNSSIATLRCQVTSITALSDERDKTSIEDLPYGLDFVNSLQPKKFVWDNREESDKYGNKSFSSRKGAKDIGFIAQELQSVDDDFLNLVYDANPEKLEATYGRLVPVLVKAIQDLSAKVTTLENA